MNKFKIFFFFFLLKACSFHQLEQSFGSRNNDFDTCMVQDINKCPDIKFEAKGFQCCKCTYNNSPICNPMVSPIKSAQDEMATENGKILTREYIGFALFNDGQQYISYDFECPDGKFGFKYETKNYTTGEQEKFKDQNHCLKYFNEKPESIKEDTCYNAKLATTGNSNVTCGYYEFDIIMTDNSTTKYQTCFLYNDDIRTTKNMGNLIKQMAENVAVMAAIYKEKELLSYQMTGTNSENKYFIYYSVNDTVISPSDVEPTDSDEPSDTTDGTKPNLSKFINGRYILVLILFYILSY